MKRVDLCNTKEFQSWINGLFGFFENALYDTLLHKKTSVMLWNTPSILALILQDSILISYSTSDAMKKLIDSEGKAEIYLRRKAREILRSKSEVLQSLVAARLKEWYRTSIWSCMAAYHGSYESVARELRFVLEDAAQSLYADQQKPEYSLKEKIQWIAIKPPKGGRHRGRKLIGKLDIPDDIKITMKDLYGNLCDDVHPSAELIRRDIDLKQFYFEYREKWFDKSYKLHRKTFDLALALAVYQFPKAIPEFLKFHNGDELKNLGYENTLKVCRNYTP